MTNFHNLLGKNHSVGNEYQGRNSILLLTRRILYRIGLCHLAAPSHPINCQLQAKKSPELPGFQVFFHL